MGGTAAAAADAIQTCAYSFKGVQALLQREDRRRRVRHDARLRPWCGTRHKAMQQQGIRAKRNEDVRELSTARASSFSVDVGGLLLDPPPRPTPPTLCVLAHPPHIPP